MAGVLYAYVSPWALIQGVVNWNHWPTVDALDPMAVDDPQKTFGSFVFTLVFGPASVFAKH